MKKIDIHVHTIEEPDLLRPRGDTFATPEQLFAMYDQLGVEKAVLLPILSQEGGYDTNTNREILRIVRRWPDRFYWFCNVDPRCGKNGPDTDYGQILRHYKSLGAAGVGEFTANLPMDDPRVDALFAACEALSMPVTIHIGDLGGDYGLVDSLGLPKLERALRKFPKLIILGHSQKFWSEIGSDVTEENRGGNPKGPVQPGGRIPELMRKYPNLCGDLSAGSGCNAIMRDPEFGYAFLEEFQDRLFYGTDICSPNDITHIRVKMGPFLEEGVASGKLSLQACEKICWRNAQRLLEGRWQNG